mgnify:CR=1 FL=1
MSGSIARPPKLQEDALDTHLRPQRLSEFVGQTKNKLNLSIFIEAAKSRNEALDHVLFAGPPGLGKTTLAQIMAREMGVNFRATSGPVIAKAGDLAALLTNLEERDVLFIDVADRNHFAQPAGAVDVARALAADSDAGERDFAVRSRGRAELLGETGTASAADRSRVPNPDAWGSYYALAPSVYAVHRDVVGARVSRDVGAAAHV